MTIAVDLGRKATKPTNQPTVQWSPFIMLYLGSIRRGPVISDWGNFTKELDDLGHFPKIPYSFVEFNGKKFWQPQHDLCYKETAEYLVDP